MNDSMDRLCNTIQAARGQDINLSRTARLLHKGPAKVGKKLTEEAVEIALAAVQRDRKAVVLESADLLYHLWAVSGVTPAQVNAEILRREAMLGIAEKLPKSPEAWQKPGQDHTADVVIRLAKR